MRTPRRIAQSTYWQFIGRSRFEPNAAFLNLIEHKAEVSETFVEQTSFWRLCVGSSPLQYNLPFY